MLRSAHLAAQPVVPRPTPPFNFVVSVSAGRDTFPVLTLNALIFALPLAEVAFGKYAVNAAQMPDEALDEYKSLQLSRNPGSRFDEVYPVDLSSCANAEDLVHDFLWCGDATIFNLAREPSFPGVYGPAQMLLASYFGFTS